MRIAVVSDIHGNLPALQAVVRDFSRRDVAAVVNLGDSLSGPLQPLETARFLMAQDWVHLAGNHERQLMTPAQRAQNASDEFAHAQLGARELDWVATLVPRRRYSAEVFLCHGTPESDVGYLLETVTPTHLRAASAQEVEARLGAVAAEARVVVCGHTHVPRAVRTSRGTLVVNPGSVGLPAYDAHHPYPHAVENGAPDARYAIVEQAGEHGDAWMATLLAVPYDHMARAALAQERQRPDWARALATGYMT
jgi:predicted phosphodiesterase